jgi:hypothetical protein
MQTALAVREAANLHANQLKQPSPALELLEGQSRVASDLAARAQTSGQSRKLVPHQGGGDCRHQCDYPTRRRQDQ